MPQEESTPKPGILTWHLPVLLLTGAVALYARFFRADPFGFFEDDFFYYVQVARNLAEHHLSSFDGVHLTNGYHPLWLLTLTGLYAIFPGTAFFVAVQTASLLLLLLFYLAAVRVMERLGSAEAGDRQVRLAALLLSLHALLLFRYGMEVTAALPLGLATVAYTLGGRFRWTGGQTVRYGLLACLTVLARLDALLLIALLFLGQMLASRASWAERLKRTALFSLGFIPLLLYLAINLKVFHSLMPVSGHAKQLKPLWPPSLVPVTSLVLPLDRMKAVFVLPALLLLALGIGRLVQLWPERRRRNRALSCGLLAFPFVHLATLSLLSDWPVWPWYFYSLSFSSVASLALLLRRAPSRAGMPHVWTPVLATASAGYVLYLGVYSVRKQPSAMALLANDVAIYAHQHPGNYAMGDEAGTAAWLSQQPIVQLEGLMMDAGYLRLIADRTPLSEVFRRYDTRYYVLLGVLPGADRCTHSSEPTQGGAHSPHMLGITCAAPLAHFERDGVSMNIFDARAVR